MSRGKPFSKGESGNPSGRPRGARHKTTLAVEAILDGEAEALTRKAIELAIAGDTTALRLCLERISPPRKDRPVAFRLRSVESASEAAAAMADVVGAVASGKLTPTEAVDVAKIIETFVRSLETSDFELRIRTLEGGGPALLPEKQR
jgi:Family of unknown function (DUF5681)